MTADLPPAPALVYPLDRTMAGGFRVAYVRLGADSAMLAAADGLQFFTPHLFAGLACGVGPVLTSPGGMGVVGPAFGATGAIGGPWRATTKLSMLMGGLSNPGASGRFLTAALPELELGYHLDSSSRLSIAAGLFLPFGEPVSTGNVFLALSIATRHGLPYRQDSSF